MSKEEWQALYSELDKIYSRFLIGYQVYQNGKNKKMREEGGKEADHAIFLANYHIQKTSEAFELLLGPVKDGFSRAISYAEFKQRRYFGGDLRDFLEKIKNKIQTM